MLHVYQSIFMLIQQGHFQKRDNGIISKPIGRQQAVQDMTEEVTAYTGADIGGGCRGCALPPPEMTCGYLIQLVFCQKKKTCGLLVLK